MNPFASLAVAILLGVAGQGLLKHGAVQGATASFEDLFLKWPIILGLGTYFASAIFYIMSLRHLPLSAAFSSVSTSYVLVALIGYFFFNEPFGGKQITALALIMGGVFLMFKP
jgi:small multidrug resistance pump